MKRLLVVASCLFLVSFQAPVYAGDSFEDKNNCSSMTDGSFKCASYVASEAFFSIISDASIPQSQAVKTCIEVLSDQLDADLVGSRNFSKGEIVLTVSASKDVFSCDAVKLKPSRASASPALASLGLALSGAIMLGSTSDKPVSIF